MNNPDKACETGTRPTLANRIRLITRPIMLSGVRCCRRVMSVMAKYPLPTPTTSSTANASQVEEMKAKEISAAPKLATRATIKRFSSAA